MRSLHKIITLLAAATLCGTMLTGCMDKEINIAEEDLPYGATMRETKTTYALPVSYDRRFVNEAQLKVLTDYLYAIQTGDGDGYAANTLDFYAEYQLKEVYSTQYKTMDEMITALQGSVAELTGKDFEFAMVTIDGFTKERDTSGLNTMIEILDKLDGDADFLDSIDNCWALDMDWLIRYNNGGSSALVQEQYVFMFEIDGQYYCVM